MTPVAPDGEFRYHAELARRSASARQSAWKVAMKQGIHPDYHEITVIMTDGTSFTTRSCYGKPGDTLRLDIDPKSHPAWTGQQRMVVDTAGQVAKFSKRFAVDMSKMNIKPAASINKGTAPKAAGAPAKGAAPAKKKK